MARRLIKTLLLALGISACEGWEIMERTASFEEGQAFRIRVLSMESCPLPAHLDPKNVTLISYRVSLEGNHASNVPANYFYATLVTTEGDRYLSTYYGCQPVLADAPLQPAQSTEGFLNFSLPPSKVPEKLVYAPNLMEMSKEASTMELVIDANASSKASDSMGEDSP